ncbi:MAG: PQQ-binding-like beta-propeller repeat protein [Solirubrobacteraceae bacterium]
MGLARTWKEWISARVCGRRALPLALTALVVACGSQSAKAINPGPPAGGAGGTAAVAVAPGDWPTFGYDSARSGVAPASGITAANARQLMLRTVQIDGIADTAAVELHGVKVHGRRHDLALVTTTYGKTIAIDPGTGRQLWEFRPPGVNATPGNPQVATSTPTVDPTRRYVYSASPNGVIHKLSVATGGQVWGRSVTFDAHHEKLASALSVSGRYLVVATGGYISDIPPYDGHVVTIDRASGRIVQVWNTECSNQHRLIRATSCPVTTNRGDDAIWGRAGPVIEPGSRRILVATGNGPFDGHTNWGNSVLELTPDASHLLHNWTPVNGNQLSGADLDVGSTSPVVLPPYHGLRLAVQGGKDSKLHLLDLARLNGTTGQASGRLGGELQQISAPGGDLVFSAPAVETIGGTVYVFATTASGTAAYELVGGGRPRLRVAWQNGTGGTSPVLSGGLLFVYNQQDGALIIRNPLSGAQIRSLPVPHGHWNSPIVVGGRIILPTGSYFDHSTSSTVAIYHLPGR